MLAPHYRLTLLNSTGQTLAANVSSVKGLRYKWTNGTKEYESSEATLLDINSTVTTGTYFNGTSIDNTTTKWDGGHLTATIVAPASSNGDVVIFYETSSDGGTTWPDAGQGVPIARVNFTTSGTKRVNMEL